jgi:DNA methylase N-4/N-6
MKKELKVVSLDQLKGYGGNPRHNNKSAEMVAKSIEQFGYINPIVVDENCVILAGNTRFKALNLLGYKEAEVLVISGLTETQKNGFVIADNRAGEYSKWNMAALERMLENSDLDTEVLEEFGILSVSKTKKKLEKLIYGQA